VAGLLLVVVAGVSLWIGGAVGYRMAGDHRRDAGATAPSGPADSESGVKWWTCSMHPQIRMDHPDKCPLCGMDLEPVKSTAGGDQSEQADQLTLSEHARAMARVATSLVTRRQLFKEIRTVGRVELDETSVAKISARVDGRVDEVFANFPGTPVREGEHLVSIYSPDLVSTQEEFLINYRREEEQRRAGRALPGLPLSASSQRRLQLWGITAEQLDELARTGKVQTHLTVYAPIGGTVMEKNIRAGQYVKQGDVLYTIADLRQVWLILEIYESELSWVRFGQSVHVALESQPTQTVTGTVGFIEPLLNEATRTVRVRVILPNRKGDFKPGMYAQASLRIPIMPDGGPAPTGLEGKYVCPMHPYVVAEGPGECNVCRMPLERVPQPQVAAQQVGAPLASPDGQPPTVLAVAADAVLTTGRRQLVYVERQPGQYEMVEPKLGPRAGDFYPVLGGLSDGDRVVTGGSFLLDSQFQISGKPSLLYPTGVVGGEAGDAGPQAKEPSPKEMANLQKLAPADRDLAMAQKVCPVTGLALGSMGVPVKIDVNGRTVFLCCKGCEETVKNDRDAVLKKLGPVPSTNHREHERM
jgi:Cu(I)/Ag(I) efflux system membrane fusion protein